MKISKLPLTILVCLFFYSSLFSQVFEFTTAGSTGTTGPDQTMVDNAYMGTSLEGQVTVTAGIQFWTVPTTGTYQIEVCGAQGFGSFGGRGAFISGIFNLTQGDQLKILVGQEAPPYLNFPSSTYNHQYGGGGGSFVTDDMNNPLIIAGGGGGSHLSSYMASVDGQITEDGAAGIGALVGAGGTMGNGGADANSADGGGGLLTNGAGQAGGIAFVNGGNGGFDEGFGGFGAGGGTSSWNNYRGGGGGGYSGGGTSDNGGSCCAAGGGGGSFNSGINPMAIAGFQLDDGKVTIRSCDGVAQDYYADLDGDGYSDGTIINTSCDLGEDYKLQGDLTGLEIDCNDQDPNLTFIGASCDDGNDETFGETIDGNCQCAGGIPIPTMGQWALLILSLLFVIVGVLVIENKRSTYSLK